MNNSDERSTDPEIAVPPTGVVPLSPTGATGASEMIEADDTDADLQSHLRDLEAGKLDNIDVVAEPAPRPRTRTRRRASNLTSRRVIPSGKVSPNGDRAWPRPSKTARRLTWGAVGIAALATTAGTVLAVRKVVDLISDDHDDRRRSEHGDRASRYTAHHFTDTPPAPQPAKPKRSFVTQVNETAQSLERIAAVVAQTMQTVRSVGDQADELIGGVKRTADNLRATLDPEAVGTPTTGPRPSHAPDLDGNPRRDDPTTV